VRLSPFNGRYQVKAIVLHSIKYSDTARVVRLFTQDFGLRAYLVRGFGNKKGTKTALYQSFSLLEITVQEKRRGELHVLKEERRAYAFQDLPFHPIKGAVAIFLAELLERSIAEDQEHKGLFEFAWSSIQVLDLQDRFGLFPLHFISNIIFFLGLMPEGPKGNEHWLDLVTGNWELFQPGHKEVLDRALGAAFVNAASGTETLEPFLKSGNERKELLLAQVRFLQLHVAGKRDLKSLPILQELFS